MNNTGASVSYSPVFQVPLGPLNIMPYGERILFAGLYPRSGNCYTSTKKKKGGGKLKVISISFCNNSETKGFALKILTERITKLRNSDYDWMLWTNPCTYRVTGSIVDFTMSAGFAFEVWKVEKGSVYKVVVTHFGARVFVL